VFVGPAVITFELLANTPAELSREMPTFLRVVESLPIVVN
jgi:hypothetical protein